MKIKNLRLPGELSNLTYGVAMSNACRICQMGWNGFSFCQKLPLSLHVGFEYSVGDGLSYLFTQVLLTPTHLAIVMEYAAGGELYERICNAGRLCENEKVCHRDLKLENALLDDSTAPRLKICDFGSSKSLLPHSQQKTIAGTAAYIAPEVLSQSQYDGEIADVWSCGVSLYVMIVGAYPFEDPKDPMNFRRTILRTLTECYSIPDNVRVSVECRDFLAKIFVAKPEKRITMSEVKNHSWFLKNLPMEMSEGGSWERNDVTYPSQSIEELQYIIQEARKP